MIVSWFGVYNISLVMVLVFWSIFYYFCDKLVYFLFYFLDLFSSLSSHFTLNVFDFFHNLSPMMSLVSSMLFFVLSCQLFCSICLSQFDWLFCLYQCFSVSYWVFFVVVFSSFCFTVLRSLPLVWIVVIIVSVE